MATMMKGGGIRLRDSLPLKLLLGYFYSPFVSVTEGNWTIQRVCPSPWRCLHQKVSIFFFFLHM